MNKQNIFTKTATYGVSALLLTGALAIPAHAQAAADQTQTTTAPAAKQDATDNGSYATGTPLQMQSKEGFWGHMNPLARKKWVKRQMDPVKDRVNELDQLQAKNANDIRDVDSRATAGIKKANDAALMADAHATEAGNRADAANSTATAASTRTDALHGTVTNLDQYSAVTSTPVAFPKGRTTLGTKAKADLDDVATKLSSEKGYIIEVQGYSRAGVGTSTAMADSVVRYLVTEHQVPIYKIYRSGMGKASAKSTPEGEKTLANGVRVTLLHNSLATMDGGSTVSSTTPSSHNVAVSSTTGGSLQ
ncbi:OmpA family protein [Terriglobus roseus]|uniref:OmpA family protein n=1 Tax=Terriglobus roseus TaxID=392734 RepID=A0A1H4S4I6_9BACT|nr:OmpA family protein [Terriglobus roseus]SEC39105.1 OmpA family protein [Terriglobus roseus]